VLQLIEPFERDGTLVKRNRTEIERDIANYTVIEHEQRARALNLESIFVLTTRTMHWFIKRGFVQADPDWLPEARKRKYNWDRRSQVFVKKLT
jgi:amino-acid N-acetyltransferase